MIKNPNQQTTIGRLAKSAGLSTATLRYYEKLGLIKSLPRQPRGPRQFAAEVQKNLRAISRFQEMGFTLREVFKLLRLSPERGPYKSMLKTKLLEVERQLKVERRKKQILSQALRRAKP